MCHHNRLPRAMCTEWFDHVYWVCLYSGGGVTSQGSVIRSYHTCVPSSTTDAEP